MSSWHDRVPSFQDHPGVWSISAICHIQTNGRNHHIHPNQDANAQSNHLIEWRLTNLMVPHVRHVAVMVNKWSTCRMKPLTDTYGSNAWNIKDIYIYISLSLIKLSMHTTFGHANPHGFRTLLRRLARNFLVIFLENLPVGDFRVATKHRGVPGWKITVVFFESLFNWIKVTLW